MDLYILRHGLAAEASAVRTDSERPLTAEGVRKLVKIAAGMARLGLKFDLVFSSPYLRARQTAELVAETLKARKRLEFTDALEPGADHGALIKLLKGRGGEVENVLLVGHEPYLSELISLLVGGDLRSTVNLKKGGLCKLSLEAVRGGRCGVLEWLLTPKQLILISED